MADNIHAPKITEITQRLVLESGSYYGAAKRLGNPNLRASLYRLLNEANFKPSKEIMKALLNSEGIKLVAFEAHPDSEIFDPAKLLAMGQIVAILVIPPDEWKRHSIECAVCGEPTPRWSASQKYCPAHSWQTAEGRRFQRKAKSTPI